MFDGAIKALYIFLKTYFGFDGCHAAVIAGICFFGGWRG